MGIMFFTWLKCFVALCCFHTLQVLTLMSKNSLQYQNSTSDTAMIHVKIPARSFCKGVNSFLDLSLRMCVTINHKETTQPLYSPCHKNTFLRNGVCIGRHESPLEQGCPLRYEINEQGQCVYIISYSPIEKICPEDFKLHRDIRSQARVCLKESWVHPFYVEKTRQNTLESDCRKNSMMNCLPSVEIQCPSGYRFIRNPPNRIQKDNVLQNVLNNMTDGLCHGYIIIPPSPTQHCLKGYRWSKRLAGCVKLDVINPTMQCPWPDRHIGYGKGDLKTPKFEYDATCQCCVASEFPAMHPQCPPGWALEGPLGSTCARKVFSPIKYDCENAKGFTLRSNNKTKEYYCEGYVEILHYSPGSSYLTQRSKSDSAHINSGQKSWSLQEGFWFAQQIANRHNKEEKTQEKKEKEEETPISPFVNLTTDDLLLLQETLNTENLNIPFFVYENTSSNIKKQKENTLEDLSVEMIPTEKAKDEDLEVPFIIKTDDAFHSDGPYFDKSNLGPRAPGSLSYGGGSPMSYDSRLHLLSKKRGLF